MKNLTLIILVIAVFTACEKPTKNIEYTLQIINPYSIERYNEAITIKREDLQGAAENTAKFPAIANTMNELYPYQLDDLDGDGQWDELFFLVDLKPKDTLVLKMEYQKTQRATHFTSLANVRFGSKNEPYEELDNVTRLSDGDTKITSQVFQMEGPAWENDVVGFRNYFDARNGMDIFGKQTSKMVLDSAGIKGQNYHALDDWGMDILKVGTSLGAGAIALKQNDSIYRWSPSGEASYRRIADGPLRSILELKYNNWQVDGSKVNLTHRISIWGGANYFKSEVTVENIPDSTMSLVTGIVNLHSDSLYFGNFQDDVIFATHDKQAENQAYLGMGIILERKDYIDHYEAPNEGNGVINTYVTEVKIEEGKPVTFYFYAGWENQNPEFKNLGYLLSNMKSTSDLLFHPVVVK